MLQDPELEGDGMRYRVGILDGEMAASGGPNAPFSKGGGASKRFRGT